MPIPLVAANWKMHTSVQEGVRLATAMREGLDGIRGLEKVLCPPFISLVPIRGVLEGSSVRLGAQNMHPEEEGPFTGEVSPRMLAGLCEFVILGHSERRKHFGESDEFIHRKVEAAFRAGLRPILCVGETWEERSAGKAEEVVTRQLRIALEGVPFPQGLAVAYEPVWAIGTGVPATPEAAQEMMERILEVLCTLYGEHTALEIPLLYGGSVTPENIEGFVSKPLVHGALVGGASLKPDQFIEIARTTALAKGVA
jgi:triosephosphate isomerase